MACFHVSRCEPCSLGCRSNEANTVLTGACTAEKELNADDDPEKRGWLTSALTSSGSSLALAFICTKALLPVRVPLTLAITPPIARYESYMVDSAWKLALKQAFLYLKSKIWI